MGTAGNDGYKSIFGGEFLVKPITVCAVEPVSGNSGKRTTESPGNGLLNPVSGGFYVRGPSYKNAKSRKDNLRNGWLSQKLLRTLECSFHSELRE